MQPNQHVVLLGVVDRRGQHSKQNPTICSSRGQCRFISSQVKLVFFIVWSPLQFTQVPQTPDQAVFVLTTTTTDGHKMIALPLAAHALGVMTSVLYTQITGKLLTVYINMHKLL